MEDIPIVTQCYYLNVNWNDNSGMLILNSSVGK